MLACVLLCRHSASDTDFPLPESRQGTPTASQGADDVNPGLPGYLRPGASHRPAVCSLLGLRDHPNLSLSQPQRDFMKRAKDLKYGGPTNKWAPIDKSCLLKE